MAYIDGFVAPVLPGKRDAYAEMAREASKIFLEHGAIQVVEALSDDVPHGKVTDFYRAVAAEENEAIAFSWIVWPSKQVRDEANQKMRNDPRMQMTPDMPFDGKRMIFGGFEVLLDTGDMRA